MFRLDLNFKILVIMITILNVLCVAVKVCVTGAAGRTGSFVFQKLLSQKDIEVVGLVRTQKSASKLINLGATQDNIVLGDITNEKELETIFKGVDKVVLCTSAVPKIKIFSLIKTILFKLVGQSSRPEFYFPPNGDPYYVDWLGAKNQIDAAKKAGVKQFVFLSSMGGTQPENFLNTIGKIEGNDKSGNILLWKRKAEEYLVASGIPYTIIHPGGLIDKAGGQRKIVYGVNDELLLEKVKSIPREDVAEVCVQSLLNKNALKKSFDIISKEPGDGLVTEDWKMFFNSPGIYKY